MGCTGFREEEGAKSGSGGPGQTPRPGSAGSVPAYICLYTAHTRRTHGTHTQAGALIALVGGRRIHRLAYRCQPRQLTRFLPNCSAVQNRRAAARGGIRGQAAAGRPGPGDEYSSQSGMFDDRGPTWRFREWRVGCANPFPLTRHTTEKARLNGCCCQERRWKIRARTFRTRAPLTLRRS